MELTAPISQYTSEFTHSVDEKGRVALPKKWRAMGDEGDYYFAWYESQRGYVVVDTPAGVSKVTQRIEAAAGNTSVKLKLKEAYFGQGCRFGCDSLGRISLSKQLMEKAGLKGNVTFVGQGDSFAIWNAEKYAALQATDPSDVLALMDSLGV